MPAISRFKNNRPTAILMSIYSFYSLTSKFLSFFLPFLPFQLQLTHCAQQKHFPAVNVLADVADAIVIASSGNKQHLMIIPFRNTLSKVQQQN